MLFDLKGKRRRAVQGTYLTLAILMAAGLILFGIGSSTNGGLGDLFGGGNGSNKADTAFQNKINATERTLRLHPNDPGALASLVRAHFAFASSKTDPNATTLSKDAIPELQKASAAWQRYLDVAKKPQLSLAILMNQAYQALAQATGNKTFYGNEADTLLVIAAAKPTPANYVTVVQAATLAGQTAKADRAGAKAISLAPKSQRKSVKQQVAQAKSPQSAQSGQAAPSSGGQAP